MSARNGVNIPIGANLEPFKRAMVSLQGHLQTIQGKLDAVTTSLSTRVSMPLLAIGGASTMMAANVEASLIKINTLVGTSGKEFAAMRASIDKVSEATGVAKLALAEAAFTIQSAGVKGAESLQLLEQSAKASVLGLGDQQALARAGTAMMQAYGKETIGAARSMDLLTAVVREGNMEASELAPSIGKVLPLASALGVSFEEVGANIAVFTRLGVSAGESVTALRATLAAILKPTTEAKTELEKYGLTFDKLREKLRSEGLLSVLNLLKQATDGNVESMGRIIPSVEALADVLGTAGAQGDAYVTVLGNIKNSTGLVDQGFKTASGGGLLEFQKGMTTLKNAGIEIGNMLMPIMTKIVGVVREAVQSFNSLSDSKKQTIVQVGLLVAGLPLVTSALSTMIGVMKGMYAVVTASVIPAVTKFAAAVGAGSPLAIGILATGALVAVSAIYWEDFKKVIEKATGSIAEFVNRNQYVRDGMLQISHALYSIGRVAEAVNTTIIEVGKSLFSLFTLNAQKIASQSSSSGQAIVDAWGGLFDRIASDYDDLFLYFNTKQFSAITGDEIQGVVDRVMQPVKDLMTWFNNLFKSTSPVAAIEAQVGAATESFRMLGIEGEDAMARLSATLAGMRPKLNEFNADLSLMRQMIFEALQAINENIQDMTIRMVEDISAAMLMGVGEMMSGTSDFGDVFRNIFMVTAQYLEHIGRHALSMAGILAKLKVAMLALSPGQLLAVGAFSLVAAGAIRSSMNNMRSNVPALANGGLAYGPTMALVGEYGNAKANPEVIAPLSKLKGMLEDVGGGGRMHTRLRGADLYISNNRYSYEYNRTTGNYL